MAYKDKNQNTLYLREYRKKYPEKIKENNKKQYLKNIEKVKLKNKNYRLNNKKNISIQKKEYYNKNSELLLNKMRIKKKKNIDNITDSYITSILQTTMFKSFKISIKTKEIPKELIELTRKNLKIKRKLNKTKHGKN